MPKPQGLDQKSSLKTFPLAPGTREEHLAVVTFDQVHSLGGANAFPPLIAGT
jgi:hypothetical protein